jgi:hypothetical protein
LPAGKPVGRRRTVAAIIRGNRAGRADTGHDLRLTFIERRPWKLVVAQ